MAKTDFDSKLRQYVRLVEGELGQSVPENGDAGYRSLTDAMRYSLLSGGKRIRGVMILAFYRLFREDVTPALPFAAAIEMVHAYSLIHDDLPCMDDDDMRRGKPSCHIAYGEAVALLAGDGLLTLAFEKAVSTPDVISAEAVRKALILLSRSAGMRGMIAGQMMDLEGTGNSLPAERLDQINSLKTGELIQAAAGIGCILAGAAESQQAIAREYAGYVGRAFQIVDDILDVTADAAALGKPVGSDQRGNKNTYAALYGVDVCRQLVDELTGKAKKKLRETGLDTAFLCELADMLGGRSY